MVYLIKVHSYAIVQPDFHAHRINMICQSYMEHTLHGNEAEWGPNPPFFNYNEKKIVSKSFSLLCLYCISKTNSFLITSKKANWLGDLRGGEYIG